MPLTKEQVLDKISKGESFQGIEIDVVDFSTYVFMDAVDFQYAIFIGDTNFSSSIFKDKVDFSYVIFKGKVIFDFTIFEGEAYFKQTTFESLTSYSGSIFNNKTDFTFTNFKNIVIFSFSVFNSAVYFHTAFFNTSAYFYSVTFQGMADFSSSEFRSLVDFKRCQFRSITYFDYAIFCCVSDFTKSLFEGDTYFKFSRFENTIQFKYVTFNASVIYSKATFIQLADFHFTNFNGTSFFLNVSFLSKSDFSSATFDQMADFSYSRFDRETYFYNTSFNSSAFFIGEARSGIPENKCFYNEIDWSYVKFMKPQLIHFTSVDFGFCKLSYADFSSVNLINIKWTVIINDTVVLRIAKYLEKHILLEPFHLMNNKIYLKFRNIIIGISGAKSKAIYDNLILNNLNVETQDAINYSIVESAYRRIKTNYEKNGNYSYAGRFHFGEMEMKRLSKKTFSKSRLLIATYRVLSGYGEVLARSVYMLIGTILLFSYLSLFTGLKPGNSNINNTQITQIEYDLFSNHNTRSVKLGEVISDYYTSISHSCEVIILRRDKLVESYTDTGRLLEFFQIILVTTFVTLSILTLKRKFHR